MKRTNLRSKGQLQLKRRLELVRTTIRELGTTELAQVNGGGEAPAAPSCWCGYSGDSVRNK